MVGQTEGAALLEGAEACREGRGVPAPPTGPSAAGAAAALDHALALLLDPKARGLHARHASAVERAVRRTAADGGIAVAELPRVALLLELAVPAAAEQGSDTDGAGDAAVLTAPLSAVLGLLGQPLVRRAVSDEARLPGALAAALAALSSALGSGMPQQLRCEAAAALERIASAYHCRPSSLQLAAAAASTAEQQDWRITTRGGSGDAPLQLLPPPPPDAGAADAAAWRTYHLNQRCGWVGGCG
jgi:hypothetical protein